MIPRWDKITSWPPTRENIEQLNALMSELTRVLGMKTSQNICLDKSGGNWTLYSTEYKGFWAMIDDSDAGTFAHAWHEVEKLAGGLFQTVASGRSGTLTVDPAYDVNHEIAPDGAYVFLYPGIFTPGGTSTRDYLFILGGGEVGSALTVQDAVSSPSVTVTNVNKISFTDGAYAYLSVANLGGGHAQVAVESLVPVGTVNNEYNTYVTNAYTTININQTYIDNSIDGDVITITINEQNVTNLITNVLNQYTSITNVNGTLIQNFYNYEGDVITSVPIACIPACDPTRTQCYDPCLYCADIPSYYKVNIYTATGRLLAVKGNRNLTYRGACLWREEFATWRITAERLPNAIRVIIEYQDGVDWVEVATYSSGVIDTCCEDVVLTRSALDQSYGTVPLNVHIVNGDDCEPCGNCEVDPCDDPCDDCSAGAAREYDLTFAALTDGGQACTAANLDWRVCYLSACLWQATVGDWRVEVEWAGGEPELRLQVNDGGWTTVATGLPPVNANLTCCDPILFLMANSGCGSVDFTVVATPVGDCVPCAGSDDCAECTQCPPDSVPSSFHWQPSFFLDHTPQVWDCYAGLNRLWKLAWVSNCVWEEEYGDWLVRLTKTEVIAGLSHKNKLFLEHSSDPGVTAFSFESDTLSNLQCNVPVILWTSSHGYASFDDFYQGCGNPYYFNTPTRVYPQNNTDCGETSGDLDCNDGESWPSTKTVTLTLDVDDDSACDVAQYIDPIPCLSGFTSLVLDKVYNDDLDRWEYRGQSAFYTNGDYFAGVILDRAYTIANGISCGEWPAGGVAVTDGVAYAEWRCQIYCESAVWYAAINWFVARGGPDDTECGDPCWYDEIEGNTSIIEIPNPGNPLDEEYNCVYAQGGGGTTIEDDCTMVNRLQVV